MNPSWEAIKLAFSPPAPAMRVKQVTDKAAEFGISPASAMMIRLRYLSQRKAELQILIDWCAEHESDDPKTDYLLTETLIRLLQLRDRITKEEKNLSNYDKPQPKGQITDEMIAAAKETPVTNLIEFDRNGKALAFCHDDKTPSLSYNKKANRAHCFPCGKSFNAIDILMVRDNYSFINAVKELCGGAH
jgi:hypothetical protein